MIGVELSKFPIHLGPGATAEPQPQFTGEMSWYEGYGQRHDNDGAEGRLVSMYSFSTPWDSWEMHPHGAEVVFCMAGAITLIQERPGGETTSIELTPGQYAINEPGVWHTADIDEYATALFITAGIGTQHRTRTDA
jgi:quercetin dioxygenase-like cupin family protein